MGTLEAGQRPAWQSARRPRPRPPEHRASHRFADRHDERRRTTPRASISTTPVSPLPCNSTRTACTCSSRWRPAEQVAIVECPRRLARSSASMWVGRRRAWRCRPDGCTLYVSNFMDRTVSVSTTSRHCSWTAGSTFRCGRRWRPSRAEKLERDGTEGQAAVLRRQGHAARARRLHQLRLVPQRRRSRRPVWDAAASARHRNTVSLRAPALPAVVQGGNSVEVHDAQSFEGGKASLDDLLRLVDQLLLRRSDRKSAPPSSSASGSAPVGGSVPHPPDQAGGSRGPGTRTTADGRQRPCAGIAAAPVPKDREPW